MSIRKIFYFVIIIIIIFILFYPFGCQVLFIHKRCPFCPVSHFFTCLISRNIFSLKMSAVEFSHFPSFFLYGFAIIHPRKMTEPLELLFMCFLQCCFNFQLLSHHFVFTLSLLVIPFIVRKYFISEAWILLLMSFVSTQLSPPCVRIGQKIVCNTFYFGLFCNCSHP